MRGCAFWGQTSEVDTVAYLGRKKMEADFPGQLGQLPVRRAYVSPIIGSKALFGKNELQFLICSVAINLLEFW